MEAANGSVQGRKVVVAAVQFPCVQDVSKNLDNAERLIREARKKGANIILLPEIFEILYPCQIQNPQGFLLAKPYQGNTTIARMRRLAKELGVVIPVTFFEESNKVYYISVAVIDADGTDLGLYRKSHIIDLARHQEKFYFNPGDTGFKVFDTKFGRIGVGRSSIRATFTTIYLKQRLHPCKNAYDPTGVCRDQWFPEAATIMALKGAEILLYPTGFGTKPVTEDKRHLDHWMRVIQGLAASNMVPVVVSNRVGREDAVSEDGEDINVYYSGASFIAGHRGEVMALANYTGEDIVAAEFDLDQVKLDRLALGMFRDRRPDLYKALLTYDGTTAPEQSC